MNKIVIISLLCLFPCLLNAQASRSRSNTAILEDSLESLGKKMINHPEELERKNANYSFIRTLTTVLRQPNSYNFKFDSVKSITIINSPDNRFRIFSWHIMNEDGSYRYYGTVQMNNSGPLVMHPLGDYSPLIKSPEDTVTDNTKWYGAQYYQIIPVNAGTPYYVLLGWKGNTVKSTKKVIDVLSFKNGQPVFGLPVFEGNHKTRKRIVFEYTRQASMMLKYDQAHNIIVFDHLAPPDKKMDGLYQFYGPDLSYDAYKLQGGKWIFQENLDLRNIASPNDFDVDPKKQAKQDLLQASPVHH
ncbi:hypothetical protein [Mucilaginibacter sp. KACC 22063]|uniref:hypothetical protein n=1 Tax=Mucilaginibacter sp. KACC 22063 TaxID=3025666 RepID=UPI0023671E44|nr:hypothetical protein [Mucilaginibacter sp. KACC 22063]WDF57161.1 hypothetical protein PQ461_08850 [Mucilaginibacter sp. KACC 22063]